MYQACRRSVAEPGHGQDIRHDICRHARFAQPDPFVVEQIRHNDQVQTAFIDSWAGDVRGPDLIRCRRREVVGQQVIGDRQAMARIRHHLVARRPWRAVPFARLRLSPAPCSPRNLALAGMARSSVSTCLSVSRLRSGTPHPSRRDDHRCSPSMQRTVPPARIPADVRQSGHPSQGIPCSVRRGFSGYFKLPLERRGVLRSQW